MNKCGYHTVFTMFKFGYYISWCLYVSVWCTLSNDGYACSSFMNTFLFICVCKSICFELTKELDLTNFLAFKLCSQLYVSLVMLGRDKLS